MELGTKLTGEGFITCPSCELLVKEKHSLQMDRLYLSRKLQAIREIVTTDHESKESFIARVSAILLEEQ